MKQRATQVLFNYWNDVRGDRPAPRRFDIEPSRIATILPDTLILERVDFETYKFRLAGTRVCETFGLELRGANFVGLWARDDDRASFEKALSLITRQCAGTCFEFNLFDLDGNSATFELLLLPLYHTGDVVDRCLGVMSEIQDPNAPVQRPLVGPQLITQETIWPDNQSRKPELAPQQTPFADTIREARIVRADRRQFRVYDGGLSRRTD